MKENGAGVSREKSLVGIVLSLAGVSLLLLRGAAMVKASHTLSVILFILAVLGCFGGLVLSIRVLAGGKKASAQDKLYGSLGMIIGLLGLSYIVLANYFLFRLRHM